MDQSNAWFHKLGKLLEKQEYNRILSIGNINDNHWITYEIDLQSCTAGRLTVGDSSRLGAHVRVESCLKWWMSNHGFEMTCGENPAGRQDDGNSCGLFAVNTLRRHIDKSIPQLQQSDAWRERIRAYNAVLDHSVRAALVSTDGHLTVITLTHTVNAEQANESIKVMSNTGASEISPVSVLDKASQRSDFATVTLREPPAAPSAPPSGPPSSNGCDTVDDNEDLEPTSSSDVRVTVRKRRLDPRRARVDSSDSDDESDGNVPSKDGMAVPQTLDRGVREVTEGRAESPKPMKIGRNDDEARPAGVDPYHSEDEWTEEDGNGRIKKRRVLKGPLASFFYVVPPEEREAHRLKEKQKALERKEEQAGLAEVAEAVSRRVQREKDEKKRVAALARQHKHRTRVVEAEKSAGKRDLITGKKIRKSEVSLCSEIGSTEAD